MASEQVWKNGDRVRVIQPNSSYTGCRGSVVEASGRPEPGQLPLGYFVAIDGENGVARPFLSGALERTKAVSRRGDAGEPLVLTGD